MFQVDEASKILSIPLSKQPVPNKLICTDSVIKQFFVKSAYFKAKEVLDKAQNVYDNRSAIWKIIWTAKVIPKVRLFIWRLIHNIIPSNDNLKGRGIHLENKCCVCGKLGESFIHAFFFSCKMSLSV